MSKDKIIGLFQKFEHPSHAEKHYTSFFRRYENVKKLMILLNHSFALDVIRQQMNCRNMVMLISVVNVD